MSAARAEAWAFAAAIIPPRNHIDLGAAAAPATYGYQIGLYPQAGASPVFRPSGAMAALRFGTLPAPAAIVRLHLSGARPAGAAPARMQLGVAHAFGAEIDVAPTWRTYHILVPPDRQGIELTLRTNTFTPAALDPASTDTRPYGLALSWADLEYAHSTPTADDRSAIKHNRSAIRNAASARLAEQYTRRTEE
jgi:hypothetical protein